MNLELSQKSSNFILVGISEEDAEYKDSNILKDKLNDLWTEIRSNIFWDRFVLQDGEEE